MATLGDLVTILYRPRETMRRILASRDRWAVQVVVLAYLCSEVHDVTAARHIPVILPGLGFSAIAIVALGLVAVAAGWVIVLYLLSWIATFAGRKMGGVASAADVRAALAWGVVPVIWSVTYRIPVAVLESRLAWTPDANPQAQLLDVLARGGCSIVAVYLAVQFLFLVWSLFVGSCCLAEAQQFPSAKGFLNLVIALGVPVVVIVAYVVTQKLAT